jgi:hypothetical protein
MAAAIVRPELRFMADKYFQGDCEDTRILATSLLGHYNMWRDRMGMTDEASKRTMSGFASKGVSKSNANTGTMYTIDKSLLIPHLRGLGFGEIVDMHGWVH